MSTKGLNGGSSQLIQKLDIATGYAGDICSVQPLKNYGKDWFNMSKTWRVQDAAVYRSPGFNSSPQQRQNGFV